MRPRRRLFRPRDDYDYDTEADFTEVGSYDWIVESKDSLALKRTVKAVDEVLAQRGIRLVEQGADFHLSAYVSSQNRVQISDYGYGYGGWGGRYGTRSVDVYEYEEGSLVIEVFGDENKNLVWRGVATRVVNPDWTPEQREEIIREAVEALLEEFPPQ